MKQEIIASASVYQLHEILGQGASSCVYRGTRSDELGKLQQEVAIKVLSSKNLDKIWRAEFLSLSRVHSRHCVRLFAFERLQGNPALILERVSGLNLAELTSLATLTANDLRELVGQVMAGLNDLAHGGLCHGDLSLKNIMIDRSGRVVLLDFGLGNFASDCRQATLEYAAPEVLCGGKVTRQSDLFSLGRILHELSQLYGCEKKWREVISALTQSEPAKRSWPSHLNSQALAKRRLGLIVQKAERSKKLKMAATEMITPKEVGTLPSGRNYWRLVLICFLPLLMTAADKNKINLSSSLTVRSKHWLEVRLNQQPVRFAPLNLLGLQPGRHILRWRSAYGEGRRVLTLLPGQHMVLDAYDLHRRSHLRNSSRAH